MNYAIVDWKLMESFVSEVFKKYGVPEEDAKICTDVLLESDRRGIESHGVNRFKPIYLDRIKQGIQKPVTEFELIRKTATTAVVDGHDGMGQVEPGKLDLARPRRTGDLVDDPVIQRAGIFKLQRAK